MTWMRAKGLPLLLYFFLRPSYALRAMTHKALFITDWLPLGQEWIAAGISKRQKLLIDSLCRLDVVIHVLIYLPHNHRDISEEAASKIQRELTRQWNARLRVVLSRRDEPCDRESFWSYYVSPVTSLLRQSGYEPFSGRNQLRSFERCLAIKPDIVIVHRLKSMIPVLLSRTPIPPLFFDLDDVEHTAFRRQILEPPIWLTKYLQYLQIPALMTGERAAIKLSRKTFVCSEVDKSRLTMLFRTKNIVAIPNAVELPAIGPPVLAPTVLLLGHYGYRPNRFGAEYFLDDIWPKIRDAVPDARAIIAGAQPEQIKHYKRELPGVSFPGFVVDIEALYAQTKIVACPILTGGGTRVKIIEAAAFGKAIVSTSVGAEGIELKNNRDILLGDTPMTFASGCISFLRNDDMAGTFGTRARQVISTKYGRSKIVDSLATLFSEHTNIPLLHPS